MSNICIVQNIFISKLIVKYLHCTILKIPGRYSFPGPGLTYNVVLYRYFIITLNAGEAMTGYMYDKLK